MRKGVVLDAQRNFCRPPSAKADGPLAKGHVVSERAGFFLKRGEFFWDRGKKNLVEMRMIRMFWT